MFCESKVEKHKSRQEKGINFNPHANSIEDCSQYTLDGHNCCRHNWLSTTVFYKWSRAIYLPSWTCSPCVPCYQLGQIIESKPSHSPPSLDSSYLPHHKTQSTLKLVQSLRPKKILCFGLPDPSYRNRPTLDVFFTKIPRFFSSSLGSL